MKSYIIFFIVLLLESVAFVTHSTALGIAGMIIAIVSMLIYGFRNLDES